MTNQTYISADPSKIKFKNKIPLISLIILMLLFNPKIILLHSIKIINLNRNRKNYNNNNNILIIKKIPKYVNQLLNKVKMIQK